MPHLHVQYVSFFFFFFKYVIAPLLWLFWGIKKSIFDSAIIHYIQIVRQAKFEIDWNPVNDTVTTSLVLDCEPAGSRSAHGRESGRRLPGPSILAQDQVCPAQRRSGSRRQVRQRNAANDLTWPPFTPLVLRVGPYKIRDVENTDGITETRH